MGEGILLVDKPAGITSFNLVAKLRKITGIKKIGHAGTLDPFATGLMILLIGRQYTRLSDQMMGHDKTYEATLKLGQVTDTQDLDGEVTHYSDLIPTLEEALEAISAFQGTTLQTPPMYSAKKVNGKKLYELARAGKSIERAPVSVTMKIELLGYTYPHLKIEVSCTKGTYIRTLGHDIGQRLGCGAHLTTLRRTQIGKLDLKDSIDGKRLTDVHCDIEPFVKKQL